jgi:hypothetical protein
MLSQYEDKGKIRVVVLGSIYLNPEYAFFYGGVNIDVTT